MEEVHPESPGPLDLLRCVMEVLRTRRLGHGVDDYTRIWVSVGTAGSDGPPVDDSKGSTTVGGKTGRMDEPGASTGRDEGVTRDVIQKRTTATPPTIRMSGPSPGRARERRREGSEERFVFRPKPLRDPSDVRVPTAGFREMTLLVGPFSRATNVGYTGTKTRSRKRLERFGVFTGVPPAE